MAGGAVGADPDVTPIDFLNGVNRSGLNADGNTGNGLFGQSLITALELDISASVPGRLPGRANSRSA